MLEIRRLGKVSFIATITKIDHFQEFMRRCCLKNEDLKIKIHTKCYKVSQIYNNSLRNVILCVSLICLSYQKYNNQWSIPRVLNLGFYLHPLGVCKTFQEVCGRATLLSDLMVIFLKIVPKSIAGTTNFNFL